MTLSPFDHQRDEELGRLLREQLSGPAPEAFLRRLRLAVAGAERLNEWETVSRWARPRTMALAIAAGLLLWLGAWFSVDQPSNDTGVTMVSLPAHAVVMPGVATQDEFVSAVMGGR